MTANFKLPTLYLAILASSWRSLRFIISRPDDGLTAMFAMVFAMVAMSFLPPPGHSAEDPEALCHSERQLRISPWTLLRRFCYLPLLQSLSGYVSLHRVSLRCTLCCYLTGLCPFNIMWYQPITTSSLYCLNHRLHGLPDCTDLET